MNPAAPVNIGELLKSREERALRQRELLGLYEGCVLVSFTVNFPGPVKSGEDAVFIHKEGISAIDNIFAGIPSPYRELRELFTGHEYFILLKADQALIKHICCELEENHPLGRLFDADVIAEAGEPLSRAGLGLKPRSCLICGGDPAVCRRKNAHSLSELTDIIKDMIKKYREKQYI